MIFLFLLPDLLTVLALTLASEAGGNVVLVGMSMAVDDRMRLVLREVTKVCNKFLCFLIKVR